MDDIWKAQKKYTLAELQSRLLAAMETLLREVLHDAPTKDERAFVVPFVEGLRKNLGKSDLLYVTERLGHWFDGVFQSKNDFSFSNRFRDKAKHPVWAELGELLLAANKMNHDGDTSLD